MSISLQPVRSSNVDAIGYDQSTETCAVRFKNGGVYEYDGISQSQYDAFVAAPSVGAHLAVIKGLASGVRKT